MAFAYFSSNFSTGAGHSMALGFLNATAYDFTALAGSLYLGMLTDWTSEVELTGGSYTRQLITFATVTGANTYSSNTNAISFTGLPAADVNGWCIYSHVSNPATGIVYWQNLTGGVPATLNLSANDTVNQAISNIQLSFA